MTLLTKLFRKIKFHGPPVTDAENTEKSRQSQASSKLSLKHPFSNFYCNGTIVPLFLVDEEIRKKRSQMLSAPGGIDLSHIFSNKKRSHSYVA